MPKLKNIQFSPDENGGVQIVTDRAIVASFPTVDTEVYLVDVHIAYSDAAGAERGIEMKLGDQRFPLFEIDLREVRRGFSSFKIAGNGEHFTAELIVAEQTIVENAQCSILVLSLI